MRKLLIASTMIVFGTVTFAGKANAPKFDPEKIRAHVKYLASDELEGRGMNQKGGDLAADYIAAQFQELWTEACRRKWHLFPESSHGGGEDPARYHICIWPLNPVRRSN